MMLLKPPTVRRATTHCIDANGKGHPPLSDVAVPATAIWHGDNYIQLKYLKTEQSLHIMKQMRNLVPLENAMYLKSCYC